jgi:hypothetical protein
MFVIDIKKIFFSNCDALAFLRTILRSYKRYLDLQDSFKFDLRVFPSLIMYSVLPRLVVFRLSAVENLGFVQHLVVEA